MKPERQSPPGPRDRHLDLVLQERQKPNKLTRNQNEISEEINNWDNKEINYKDVKTYQITSILNLFL